MRERLGIDSSDSSRITHIDAVINSEYNLACIATESTLSINTVTLTNADATIADLPTAAEKIKAIVSPTTGPLEPVSPAQWAFYVGHYTATADKPSGPKYYIVTHNGTRLEAEVWPTPTATDAAVTAITVDNPTALSADGDVPSEIPAAYHLTLIGERAVARVALADQEIALAREAQRNSDGAFGLAFAIIRERQGQLQGDLTPDGNAGWPLPVLLGQADTRGPAQ